MDTAKTAYILFVCGQEDEHFDTLADAKADRKERLKQGWNVPSELIVVAIPFSLLWAYENEKDACAMRNRVVSDLSVAKRVLANKH